MSRARSYEVHLCEECGQPIERGRGNQFLCRNCEQALEQRKRKGQQTRQSRRNTRRARDDDW